MEYPVPGFPFRPLFAWSVGPVLVLWAARWVWTNPEGRDTKYQITVARLMGPE